MPSSKLQRQTKRAIHVAIGRIDVVENSRPVWCTGENGERLELDLWVPDLRVAFEIQGRQHYEFVPHFHTTYDNFKAQQKRDAAKKHVCDIYGIKLFEVYDDISLQEAIDAVTALAIKHAIHSEQIQQDWDTAFKNMHDRLDYLYRRLSAEKYAELFYKEAHRARQKLTSAMEKHGSQVLMNADQDMMRHLFRMVTKAMGIKRRKKIERRQRRNARKESQS